MDAINNILQINDIINIHDNLNIPIPQRAPVQHCVRDNVLDIPVSYQKKASHQIVAIRH